MSAFRAARIRRRRLIALSGIPVCRGAWRSSYFLVRDRQSRLSECNAGGAPHSCGRSVVDCRLAKRGRREDLRGRGVGRREEKTSNKSSLPHHNFHLLEQAHNTLMTSTATLPSGKPPSSLRHSPPFRHEHVGSFLRTKAVHDARSQHSQGKLSASDLRKVEDEEIRKHIDRCLHWRVPDLTDAEYRRQYFHVDFLRLLEGVEVQKNSLEQREGHVPPTLAVVSKLRHSQNIEVQNFEYLKSIISSDKHHTIKVCIPSPTMLHFRGGRKAISESAYPNLDDFFADLAACYREEIDALYQAGCRYLQLDDTNLAYLTDPSMRKAAEERGEDLKTLPEKYVKLINAAISSAPEDMVLGIHLCKGNFKSTYFAMGSSKGYEPIAEALFGTLNVDAYFLEWENPERSGQDFSALRYLPKTKTVVLGLVSSKVPALEDVDTIVARIQEAAKDVPRGIDQLSVSPQCGFSSTVHGNDLTEEEQFKKLDLCRRIAAKVWGEDKV